MKITLRLSSIAAICVVACGCTPNKIHMAGEEPGMKADIQIVGNSGVATWSWGPQHFKQQLEVVENKLVSSGVVSGGGSLKLKMHDGTLLEFDSEYAVISCAQGCAGAHMPLLWHNVQ